MDEGSLKYLRNPGYRLKESTEDEEYKRAIDEYGDRIRRLARKLVGNYCASGELRTTWRAFARAASNHLRMLDESKVAVDAPSDDGPDEEVMKLIPVTVPAEPATLDRFVVRKGDSM